MTVLKGGREGVCARVCRLLLVVALFVFSRALVLFCVAVRVHGKTALLAAVAFVLVLRHQSLQARAWHDDLARRRL